MALSAPGPDHRPPSAPGRHQEFAIEPTRKLGYRVMRVHLHHVAAACGSGPV